MSVIKFPLQEIGAKSENSLIFDLNFPEGYHLNTDAPNRYEITTDKGGKIEIAAAQGKYKSVPLTVPFTVSKTGAGVLRAKLTVYYCREDNTGVCLIKTLTWEIPLKVVSAKKTSSRIELKETLKAAD